MGIDRKLTSLKPALAAAAAQAIEAMKVAGLEICIVETNRTKEVQQAYYAQGREPLDVVNAMRRACGLWEITERENQRTVTQTLNSRHIGGNAIDLCPMKDGRCWWDAPQEVWEEMGRIGEENGLDWCAGGYGQTWGKGWDNPHFELGVWK